MSVPTWRRELSKADYMYQTYRLNVRIGEMVINGPKMIGYVHHISTTFYIYKDTEQLNP